ncbi:hypothetical protein GCM10009551_058790 [Nocardiopsis tropica]|uniref:hypothetical protein n=1 Tax=Nocardiopsis tropica TaxID=109330 RepID=UPI0031D6DFBF
MRLSALLDPDSVPLDSDATVSVLLDITAPGRAEDPDTACAPVAREAGYPPAGTARAVSLRVPVGPRLSGARVVGGTPSRRLPDGSLVVELGDFRSGEGRRLLLRLEVPGLSCPGPATVTALEAAYVDPATLAAHTAVLPVTVDVVPGGRASSRANRSDSTRERGRDGAPPREGVIRGEQTDRGRPTPDRAPPAPGGGGRRGPGTPRDPGPPPNR